MQAESPITVACIQMEPKIGEKKANVAHSLDKIAEAAGKGARLIVLPELCNSGYVFASRHEAFTLAEPVPNGPTSEVWLEAARRHGAVIVAGICERAGDALYNSAAIVGPDGFIGTYRKVHLWGAENCSSNPAISGSPYGGLSSAEWRWRSATMAGFRKPIGWRRCKAQTFFACQPTGFPCQTSPRTR